METSKTGQGVREKEERKIEEKDGREKYTRERDRRERKKGEREKVRECDEKVGQVHRRYKSEALNILIMKN